jgi:TIR domain
MPNDLQRDVFISHSAKDKAVVGPLAERLRKDGLEVWPAPPKRACVGGFDEWVIKPGDSIPARIEQRSEHSRVLACVAEGVTRRQMRPAWTGATWGRAHLILTWGIRNRALGHPFPFATTTPLSMALCWSIDSHE